MWKVPSNSRQWGTGTAISILIAGAMLARYDGARAPKPAPPASAAPETFRTATPEPRPEYPYSLIPGGVLGAAELEQRMAEDSEIAHHYQGFDAAHALLIRSRTDRAVYVSYRDGGRIFWTSHKVHIPEGEYLLTDGEHQVRSRCGNRLSEIPMKPIRGGEPSEEDLDFLPPPMPHMILSFRGEPQFASSRAPEPGVAELRLPDAGPHSAPLAPAQAAQELWPAGPRIAEQTPVFAPEPESLVLFVPVLAGGLLWRWMVSGRRNVQ